jgi:hypothetical protein
MKNNFAALSGWVAFGVVFSSLVSSMGCSTSSPHSDDSVAQVSAKHAAVWSLSGFSQPQGASYDADSHMIYVSSQSGSPQAKTHKGFISEVSLSGQMVKRKGVTALNSPSGMKTLHHTLWVSSVNELIGVQLNAKSKKTKIEVRGAQCLASITGMTVESKAKGKNKKSAFTDVLYVSDSCGKQIFKVQGGKASFFSRAPEGHTPGGLLLKDGVLYVTSSDSVAGTGDIYGIDLVTKKSDKVTQKSLGVLQGLEMDSAGNFLTLESSSGKVFRVTPQGQTKLILEQPGILSSISYVPEVNMLLISIASQDMLKAYLYDKL